MFIDYLILQAGIGFIFQTHANDALLDRCLLTLDPFFNTEYSFVSYMKQSANIFELRDTVLREFATY